jgi:hypothetical protein
LLARLHNGRFRLATAIFGRFGNIGDEDEPGGLDRLDEGRRKCLDVVSMIGYIYEILLYSPVGANCISNP